MSNADESQSGNDDIDGLSEDPCKLCIMPAAKVSSQRVWTRPKTASCVAACCLQTSSRCCLGFICSAGHGLQLQLLLLLLLLCLSAGSQCEPAHHGIAHALVVAPLVHWQRVVSLQDNTAAAMVLDAAGARTLQQHDLEQLHARH
jgi:hypothetical protein